MKFVIPENVNFIIKNLNQHGFEAYLVGGAVRDLLLGFEPHDYDICTSAIPYEIKKVFKDYRTIDTGIEHGTVSILLNGNTYEVTTFRIDGKYSDNRHPDHVKFTSDITEDLRRRDFTINAIAYNDSTGIIDPFGGQSDLNNRTIRCVGNPSDRFEEDALRMIRAIRFASQLNYTIDKGTSDEIYRMYTRLKNISQERLNSEFCKIAVTDVFSNVLIQYLPVFQQVIPEISSLIGFDQNNPYHDYDVFMHTCNALRQCISDDLVTKLSIFFHDFGKPYCYQDGEDGHRHFKGHGSSSKDITEFIMKRMRFSNDIISKVTDLVLYHDSTFEVSSRCIRRWINKIGEKQFRRLLEIRRCDILGQSIYIDQSRIDKIHDIQYLLDEVVKTESCFKLKDLQLNGDDLIKLGFKEGKEIGVVLNSALRKVLDGELQNEHDLLVEFARNSMM